MTGEELKKLLENNPYLTTIDIRHTIAYLLKRRLINPSVLIDEYTNILNEEKDKYKCHFIEADTCNFLMREGNEEQKSWADKRAKYNGMFNPTFPKKNRMDANTTEECREWFKNMYGFNPEES